MSRYKNGQVPDHALVRVGAGSNADGYWEHLLPAGTLRKHLALVALGKARSGRTLTITSGWNAYRPLPAQRVARANACARGRCGDAATPGTSSHGGEYQGADAIAIDYSNWGAVFGTRQAFYDACRQVGLEPGVFSWEPWHVIDRDPWAASPAGEAHHNEGLFMSLSEAEEREILEAARGALSSQHQVTLLQNVQSIRDRVEGNLSSLDQVLLFQNVRAVRDRVEALFEKLAPGVPVPVIDEAALAAELTAMLGPLLVENLHSITDESVAMIARAAADEQDRRARGRLTQVTT
ncbi:MAG: hypothetical protein R2732_05450 [Microbacteriaceae bacterium]